MRQIVEIELGPCRTATVLSEETPLPKNTLVEVHVMDGILAGALYTGTVLSAKPKTD